MVKQQENLSCQNVTATPFKVKWENSRKNLISKKLTSASQQICKVLDNVRQCLPHKVHVDSYQMLTGHFIWFQTVDEEK